MSSTAFRASLCLLLLGAISRQGLALDAKKWCKLNNASTKDYSLIITDWKLVVGNVYIKQFNESGEGTKLSSSKASTVLKAKTNYLWYFEPTAKALALSFAISNGEDVTEINIKRAPSLGDRLVVSPKKSTSSSPLTISLPGFRRLNGPAFITIN